MTFCINELHVSFADMMYRKKSWDEIVSVIIKMVYKRMNPDTRGKKSSHVLIYKGEEKYSRGVFMW